MQWRRYLKDVLLLGSIVLPLTVVCILGVHEAERPQAPFVDDLTSPTNLGGLAFVTAYVLIRPLRKPARRLPKPQDS